MKSKSKKPDTLLTHAGRYPEKNFGVVNPPVYHASTILHPDVAQMEAAEARRFDDVVYGRFGTPTQMALEEAMAALEGGARAVDGVLRRRRVPRLAMLRLSQGRRSCR